MAQVSNQTQLLAALAAQDSIIQVIADFTITSQITILYPVTIESLTEAAPFTLTKDTSFWISLPCPRWRHHACSGKYIGFISYQWPVTD